MKQRPPAIAGALVLVLVIAVVGWQASRPPAQTVATAEAPSMLPMAAASVPSGNATTGRLPPVATGAPAPARVAIDPTAAWSALRSPPVRAGEVEYCGIGHAPADTPEAKALAQQAADAAQSAAQRLFALMDRSADPRTRAAALLARDERDTLALAARQGSDPAVYAIAMQACLRGGPAPTSPPCAALSAEQMARLDPDNVVPWLHVAVQATQRQDTQGVAEAVYRASLAHVSRQHEFAFADLALSALPPDWPPRDAMLASAKVLEIHASLTLPSYIPVVQYCAKERMQDANLQQTCDRLARVLMERGDTLIDFGIGRRLGERAGWPAEVVELNNARMQAYVQTLSDGDTLAANAPTSTGCDALRHGVRTAFEHARYGERAAVQDKVRQAGLGDAAMLERFRQVQQRPAPLIASAPR
jgi:hypothetical protein